MAAPLNAYELPTSNAYELEREERIARNRKIMEALGLFQSDVAAAALQREKRETGHVDKPAKKRKQTEEPTRRSSRHDPNQQLTDEHGEGDAQLQRQARHEEEAEAHARRHAGSQGRAAIVGTASYEHTCMRVRTMSEKALHGRVKAIERAKGKHAVTKMRLFARVAFLEGYEEVAAAATDALQRLVELLGDVDEEEEAQEE